MSILGIIFITSISIAQKDYSLDINGVSSYGCSTWVMKDLTFRKTIDSLRSVYPSAQLANRLFIINNSQVELKKEFSNEDLIYVQSLLNIIVRDLSDILFIEKKISLNIVYEKMEKFNDKNLSPKTRCSKNTTKVDITLVSKLFLKSLNRAMVMINEYEEIDIPNAEVLDSLYFLKLWSEDFTNNVANKVDKQLKKEALIMNRIAYFTFSEFYRFFIFSLTHEMYHVITNCKVSLKHEMKADLMGAVVFQFLYRHLTYDKGQMWNCIYGNKEKYQEMNEQRLLSFLFGGDVDHIYKYLYKGTSLSHGSENYLALKEREEFISKNINEVHINQLYKDYEKIIKSFNRK